jgi:hypothetical protein
MNEFVIPIPQIVFEIGFPSLTYSYHSYNVKINTKLNIILYRKWNLERSKRAFRATLLLGVGQF